MPKGYAVVHTTVNSPQVASELARALVKQRLAACVQMSPVTSVYRWQGDIETTEEVLLVAKTTAARAPQVVEFVRRNHPYELPELLITPVSGGHEAYLEWLEEETSQPLLGT